MVSKSRLSNVAVWTLLAISLVGCGLVYYATAWGPTVSSDSVYYLGSADNLVHGRGFSLYWGEKNFRLYAGDHPFYLFVLALFQLAGLSVVSAACWVGIISFLAVIVGSGWLAYDLTRSPGLAIGTSLFRFFPSPQVSLHATSEVVFYPTALLSSLLLLRYLKTPKRYNLILAAVLAAAAFLCRYVGVALLAASVIALLLMSTISWRKRLLDRLLYSLLVCFPMLAWLGYGYFHTRTLGERSVHLADIFSFTIGFRLALAETLWRWIKLLLEPIGYETQKWWMLFLFLVLAATAGWAIWCSIKKSSVDILRFWSGFFAIYTLIYILVYFGAYASTLPTPDLVFRMFEPFLLATGLSLLGLFALAFQNCRPNWISSAVMIVLVLLMVVPEIPNGYTNLVAMHLYGNGYTGKVWMESPVIDAINGLPVGTQTIINQPDAVLFLTGRPAHWIPEIVHKNRLRKMYVLEMGELIRKVSFAKEVASWFCFLELPNRFKFSILNKPMIELPA